MIPGCKEALDIKRQQQEIPLINTGDVRKHMHLDGVEKIILGAGDCRTGTSASLGVAYLCDIPSIYQPAKSILRMNVVGEKPEDIYFAQHRRSNGNVVFAKETIGPNTIEDCSFNPLSAYVYDEETDTGVRPENMHVIFFHRNPLDILKSWKKVFQSEFYTQVLQNSPEKLFKNFMLASLTECEMYNQLLQDNIPHTVFVQELLQDVDGVGEANHVAGTVQRLFGRAGVEIPFEKAYYATNSWQDVGADTFMNGIYFPREPDYDKEGTIRSTFNAPAYRYVGTPYVDLIGSANPAEIECLQKGGVFEFYNHLLERSAEDLGIQNYKHLQIPL